MPNAEIWMTLESLAASYERTNGIRPNQLRVGTVVAEQLEPEHGAHPLHLSWVSLVPGVWFPIHPIKETGWWKQRRRERACRRAGGHWWHPADPMIEWVCCQCGADRDGMPVDGT